MLLGVSIVKETQGHWGGVSRSFWYFGNVCFWTPEEGEQVSFGYSHVIQTYRRQAPFQTVRYFIKNKRKEKKALKIAGPLGLGTGRVEYITQTHGAGQRGKLWQGRRPLQDLDAQWNEGWGRGDTGTVRAEHGVGAEPGSYDQPWKSQGG